MATPLYGSKGMYVTTHGELTPLQKGRAATVVTIATTLAGSVAAAVAAAVADAWKFQSGHDTGGPRLRWGIHGRLRQD